MNIGPRFRDPLHAIALSDPDLAGQHLDNFHVLACRPRRHGDGARAVGARRHGRTVCRVFSRECFRIVGSVLSRRRCRDLRRGERRSLRISWHDRDGALHPRVDQADKVDRRRGACVEGDIDEVVGSGCRGLRAGVQLGTTAVVAGAAHIVPARWIGPRRQDRRIQLKLSSAIVTVGNGDRVIAAPCVRAWGRSCLQQRRRMEAVWGTWVPGKVQGGPIRDQRRACSGIIQRETTREKVDVLEVVAVRRGVVHANRVGGRGRAGCDRATEKAGDHRRRHQQPTH